MSHLKKPELPRRLLQLIIAAAVAAAAAPASCSQLGYCPTNCTRPGATETDGLTLLDDRAELVASVGRAVKIARTFPGVTSDDALVVHVSFQYICCVTTDEIVGKVFPALDAVKWAPVNVSFSSAICNKDGSIILAVDDASQAALGAVVARFEAAIEAAGVAVVPRSSMQGFHSTIATTSSGYAMEQALAAINAAIPPGSWTSAPVTLSSFAFLVPVPHLVVATL